jgi:hypothetical protein
MTAIGSVTPTPGQVEATFTDLTAPPLRPVYYRITAANASGAESAPTDVVTGRALRVDAPAPPTVASLQRLPGSPPAIRITWTVEEPLEVTVQRRETEGDPVWRTVALWLSAGTLTFDDREVETAVGYLYRLRGRDSSGVLTELSAPATIAPSP